MLHRSVWRFSAALLRHFSRPLRFFSAAELGLQRIEEIRSFQFDHHEVLKIIRGKNFKPEHLGPLKKTSVPHSYYTNMVSFSDITEASVFRHLHYLLVS